MLADDSLDARVICVRETLLHRQTEEAFAAVQSADAIVVIFPLYFFCMPAMLTRFLQDFAVTYPAASKQANVYAIVNCGFPEPEINLEAMRVIESFCRHTGRIFGGGTLVGCGGMLLGAHVVGEQALEIVHMVAAGMVAGMTVAQMAHMEIAYPTYTAVLGLAARRLLTALGGYESSAHWRSLGRAAAPVAEWERRDAHA